jgi:hypothetical protein
MDKGKFESFLKPPMLQAESTGEGGNSSGKFIAIGIDFGTTLVSGRDDLLARRPC